MAEIIDILIGDIKPDENQPRKRFDPVRIKEMAKSLATEGIINPIEVDMDKIIITGEMRWRAAKELGMKTVPCKVLNIKGRDRFRRQMIENLHHNTMTTLDTAKGLKKLLSYSVGSGVKDYKISTYDLAKEVGKSEKYINTTLKLLKESGGVKKWLDDPKSKSSFIDEANRLSGKNKEIVKKKITRGEFANKEALRETIRAIKRTPEKTSEILRLNLRDKNQEQSVSEIRAVSPKEVDGVDTVQRGSMVITKLNEVLKLLKGLDQDKIFQSDRQRILDLRKDLNKELTRFEMGKMIEGEIVD